MKPGHSNLVSFDLSHMDINEMFLLQFQDLSARNPTQESKGSVDLVPINIQGNDFCPK